MAASERVLTPLAPTSNAGLSAPRRATILIAVSPRRHVRCPRPARRDHGHAARRGRSWRPGAIRVDLHRLHADVPRWTLPIYGKLSDMYGRRPFWIAGLALFMLGSALAGASQAMIHLVLARAVQGLGAGALMALGAAVFGDLFPPSERGKWQGLLAAVFGLVFIAGPTLGGWITDNLSWRWIFYVNLPLGGIALRRGVDRASGRRPPHVTCVGPARGARAGGRRCAAAARARLGGHRVPLGVGGDHRAAGGWARRAMRADRRRTAGARADRQSRIPAQPRLLPCRSPR